MAKIAAPTPTDDPSQAPYTVVARRYRPQAFDEVVGQEPVVRALKNAIELNRVTHAYLFCGTRGVGKTTLARIFAKCLNCVEGPTIHPDQTCDICRGITAGQDVDVIEIDGASNNGVDAVRELRQNAGLRPSRARFKIYYIDEVHMLSTGAFNALLKTLEEPPEHVKFLFATTEVNKIPITVLSRCQRYDLAAISPGEIASTLAGICAREGVAADPEALQAVARRASGSMRDAQSLLEQLLASGKDRLTADRVHQLLGVASDDRIVGLLEALAGRDPGAALRLLDGAVAQGVQPVDVLNGLLEFLRDAMVLAAGADVPPQAVAPAQVAKVKALAVAWTLDSVLAALQILAEARAKLRGSPHGRLLVELALARVARLEDLGELSDVIARLGAMEVGAPAPEKKKSPEPVIAAPPSPIIVAPPPSPTPPPPSLDLARVEAAWEALLEGLSIPERMRWSPIRPEAIPAPATVAFRLPASYTTGDVPSGTMPTRQQMEARLGEALGHPGPLTFAFRTAERVAAGPTVAEVIDADPMTRRLMEVFDARLVFQEREGEDAR